MVNYGLAFRKPFSDLKTLVIGIIISIIPIVNLISLGFVFKSSGVGKVKSKDKMPKWGDWFSLFVTGLLGSIALVIYMIPAMIVFVLGAGVAIMSFLGGSMLPEGMIGTAGAGPSNEVVAAMVQANLPALFGALATAAPIVMFAFVLGLIGVYLTPMAVLSYISTGKFGDAFAVGKIAKKCFTGQYFVVWLVAMIVMTIVGMVLAAIPYIGVGAGTFIGGIIGYSLLGQVYAEIK